MAKKAKVDVKVTNLGTLWHFFLLSDEAKEWVAENAEVPSYMRLGGMSFAADHGCGPDLVMGMRDAGLTVVN